MLNRKALVAAVAAMIIVGAVGAGQAFAQAGLDGPGVVKVDATPADANSPRVYRFDPNAMRGMAFDPNSYRKMMSDFQKRQLGATDEEWTVLEPKLEKVQKLNNEVRNGAMMGMYMMGPMGAGESDVAKAARELAKVLKNKDASPGDIKSAVTALRDAKAKAKIELEKAQKELKELLTIRQEALLIQQGQLD